MRRALGAVLPGLLALALAGCAGLRADGSRDRALRLGRALAGRPQARNLTCESRSAADLLAAHGIAASEGDVFALLPASDDPDTGFVGSPDDAAGGLPPAGYGVHAAPVAAALRSLGLDARAESGRGLAWLAAETAAGRPVVAWVTDGCAPSRAVEMRDRAGRAFRAVPGEHTVLVLDVGATVLVLDPATGRLHDLDVARFSAAWRLFDEAAVSASGPPPAPRAGAAAGPRTSGGSVPP